MSYLEQYTGRYWRCEPGPKPEHIYGAWVISTAERYFSRALNMSANYLDLMGKWATIGATWLRRLDKWW